MEGEEGDKPARVGARHGLVGESFPNRGSSRNLGDISHVRECVLQLPHFGVEPALAAAMTREVRFEKRARIYFGAALFTFRRAEVYPSERNNP